MRTWPTLAMLLVGLVRSARSFCRPTSRSNLRLAMSSTSHAPTAPTATVVLLKGKARLFQDGNPLVYGGAVGEVKGDPTAGDEVMVVDNMGNAIGRGLFNPFSQYRVRMLSRAYESVHNLPLLDLLKARIAQAQALRQSIGLPSKDTTCYRLVNGEGDRLGGLIVDVFDSVVVAQSSALWCERHRAVIEQALREVVLQQGEPAVSASAPVDDPAKKTKATKAAPKAKKSSSKGGRVVWRRAESRLKQDGFTGSLANDEGDSDAATLPLVVKENKLKFAVELGSSGGQKTGFYCDQRANRLTIRSLAQGKSVLDTYTFSGGFALNAALGGASRVVAVDSSLPALEAAAANARLNGIPVSFASSADSSPQGQGQGQGQGKEQGGIELVKGDCVEVMRRLAEAGEQFDVVICDPPKLAPSRKDLDRAKNKYLAINKLGLALVKPGGLLLTCTCSAAMSTQEDGLFLSTVNEAARVARRQVTLLSVSGAAADHPLSLSYMEGSYLTAALLHVQ